MHDIKFIRENPAAFDQALARRGLPAQSAEILELDKNVRAFLSKAQEIQSTRNSLAKKIGEMMGELNKNKATLSQHEKQQIELQVGEYKVQAEDLKLDAEQFARDAEEMQNQLQKILEIIPNILQDSVPEGADETQNRLEKTIGEKKTFSFTPKEHIELGESLGMMDFERAAKISGARFVILRKALARMERALAQFMLDAHVNEFGYEEIVPPYLVRDAAAYGTGQLPKFSEDLFQTTNGYWLIPTAEVPVTNMVADEILDKEKLPMRFCAYSPCFRSEAGAAGKDTKGMIRQHQFTKVELVSITTPEQSLEEHERMLSAAENILKKLGLHYRVITLCSGDTGFGSSKTYDIEVWMPGQNAYREISSCSNFMDFQARRMKARFKAAGEKTTHFVHTLNGSGLAIGRTMIAIMENYQQEDGSIQVPEALVAYMGGLKTVTKS